MKFNIASGNETLGGFGFMHGMLHSIHIDAELKKGVCAQSGESCLCWAEQQLRRSWRMGGSGYSGVVSPEPFLTPLSSACGWCLSCPRLCSGGSGDPARASPRTVPAAHLAGTRCHLAALVGLSVPGKRIFFQPNCSSAIAFLEKVCTICPRKLLSDLLRSTGSDAWSGEWASLSVEPRVWPCFEIRQVIQLPSGCAFYRRRRLGKSPKQPNDTSALLGWVLCWQMGGRQCQGLYLSLSMILARLLEKTVSFLSVYFSIFTLARSQPDQDKIL